MATVKFYDTPLKRLKIVSVKAGWLDTPEHPGYPPSRKPTGVTIAEVALFNTRERGEYTRNYAARFFERYFESGLVKKSLARDIKAAFRTKNFEGTATKEFLMEGLIAVIVSGNWVSNSPSWAAFKAAHGLSASPLIASQVMLDHISARVDRL